MKGDATAELINVAITALRLLEAEWVLQVLIEEGTQQVKRIEVELLESERHWDVATFIEIRG